MQIAPVQQAASNAAKRVKAPNPTGTPDYWQLLRIIDKNDHLIPLQLNSVQLHYQANRGTRNLSLKARQQGISTVIQADHFVRAITQTTRAATLAHDDLTTQKLRTMANTYWVNLDDIYRPARGLDNATKTTYPNTNSEVSIMTAGSANIGRGGTYSRFHGSEVAFWKDAQSIMKGVLQGVPEHGIVDLESTANGAQGWFFERCMESLDGNGYWSLFFYAWWWTPEYRLPLLEPDEIQLEPDEAELVRLHGLSLEQIKWRRYKQKELGKRDFQQEYPEDPHSCFLASGNGYFADIDNIERVFTAPSNPQYNPSHRYISAADFGQANDYSAMSVIDATTLEEVDLWRVNRVPWGDIRARMLATNQKWRCESFHPEANSMGGTNIEELHKEFAAAGCRTNIVPFDTTPQSKPPAVTAFHWAVDQGGLKLLPSMGIEAPSTVAKQEINNYTASQTSSGNWKYEGLPHDDTVIARMIAWHGCVAGAVTMGTSTTRWG